MLEQEQKQQSEISSTLAYRNFTQTCRSPSTRRIYNIGLKNFMDYLHIPDNAYDKLLEKDPKLVQMDVCDFIYATYLSGIRHFYDINGVDLHWKRIHKFEGEKEKRAKEILQERRLKAEADIRFRQREKEIRRMKLK